MATKKGTQPAPDPKVVKKLLDRMATDNEFRRLFKRDAAAALAQVGYVDEGAGCMQLKKGQKIATKAQIAKDRAKLETTLSSGFGFTPHCFQADD